MSTDSNTTTSSTEEVAIIILPVTIKDGQTERFENQFKIAAAFARKEEGSLGFQLFKVHHQENKYVVIESYQNKAALEIHLKKDYTIALLQVLEEVLTVPLMESALFSEELYPAVTKTAII